MPRLGITCGDPAGVGPEIIATWLRGLKSPSGKFFIIGPTHAPAPEMIAQEGVPKGTIHELTMRSEDSKIYPGIAREKDTWPQVDPAKIVVKSGPAPYTRRVTLYVPKQTSPAPKPRRLPAPRRA